MPHDHVSRLREEAARAGVTVDDLVRSGVDQLLTRLDAEPSQAEAEEHLRPKPRGDRRSIRELEGLGADLWSNLDIESYVGGERDSWPG